MNLFRLAWKNLTHRPLNVLLTMVLFGLGVGLVSFLILFNTQLKKQFDSNLAGIDMVVGAKGSPLQMILCSMYHIDNPTGNITVGEAKAFFTPNHPLIKRAVPLSLGDSHKGYRIVGTDYSILDLYNAEIENGELWGHVFDVVVGRAVADDLGIKIGDRFQSAHGFNDDQDMLHEHGDGFLVTGILKPTGSVIDQLILTSAKSIWDVHDHEGEGHEGHDHAAHDHSHDHDDHSGHHHESTFNLLDYPDNAITNVLVQFQSRTNFRALNMPRNINENTDMQAASPAIEINRLYSMIGVGVDALRMLAIIIAIVSAFSIFISLYNSLKDRRYELAMMRVMGATPASLFILVLIEGLILALIGYLFGTLISHIGMEVFSNFAKASYKYSLTGFTFLKAEYLILGASLVLGMIAAIIPAWQAYKTDIHNTLSKG